MSPATPPHRARSLRSVATSPFPASLHLVALLLPLTACIGAGDRTGEAGTHVEEIDGVEHVINAGDGAWTEVERWQLVEEDAVEFGEMDSDDAYVFGWVTGAIIDGMGRVHVADAQALEVRVFSPGGEFLYRYGRNGEGPGEFRNISGIGRDRAGGVAVLDGSLARVSRFSTEGDFVDSFRLERSHMIHGFNAPVYFDTAGRFHDRVSLSPRVDEPDRIAMVRYDPNGGAPDTLPIVEYEPALHIARNEAGLPIMSMPVPFAPSASTASTPDGGVYVTLGTEYRIARLSSEGDTVRIIRRELEPPAINPEERRRARAEMIETIEHATGATPRESDLPTLPDRHPALLTLNVDASGHLWALRPTGGGPAVWDIFDDGGMLLGTLDIGSMAVLDVAESATVGLIHDEYDVERIRIVPLRR